MADDLGRTARSGSGPVKLSDLARCRCSGCGKQSGLRIIGTAPEGWKRFVSPRDDAVTYRCPDCPGRPK